MAENENGRPQWQTNEAFHSTLAEIKRRITVLETEQVGTTESVKTLGKELKDEYTTLNETITKFHGKLEPVIDDYKFRYKLKNTNPNKAKTYALIVSIVVGFFTLLGALWQYR